ncbi:MAG: 16S rRNA (guanine(966)-N(2))-methyltransferase RsmD [Nevskiaceae bacterium]|nr:MAG: 16S rRNA (guanine(966)-N(2))-methyltransferase RsmD [Nevskiaceae bacterium]TBR72747.1 MAG: 16S rRNA (guanine(966)-N(2))-methyltransferase RsmD [Nevskiaceae bacterium]
MKLRHDATLRIIGGEWRSRRVAFDPACDLRPTPDRVRETLFNWLAPYIQGATCIDAFAGSGALGLEALSRGAAHVTFVERDARQVAMLQRAITLLGADARARIIHGDALAVLRSGAPCRLVFLDPPYAADALQTALAAAVPRLTPANRVYLEWPQNRPQTLPPGYALLKTGGAGRVSYGLATYRLAPAGWQEEQA